MLKIIYVNNFVILSVFIFFIMVVVIGITLLSMETMDKSLYYTLPIVICMAAITASLISSDLNETTTSDIIKYLSYSKISISSADAEKLSDHLYGKDEYTFVTTNGQTLHFNMLNKTNKGIYVTFRYKIEKDK